MQQAPRQVVWSAAAVLAGVAALGVYVGAHRAAGGPGEMFDSTVGAGAAGRATRAAEPAPPLPSMDEAQVRQIARQEAEAVLTHPHQGSSKKPKADDADASTATTDDSGADNGSPSNDAGAPTTPPAAPASPPPSASSGPPD